MVEVFDEDCLWKCAEVLRAAADSDSQLRVKIVGAAKVLTVAPSKLRVRQVLRDDNVWVALHKDNQIAGASAVPLRANGGLKPLKQKRILCMFDGEPIANGNRVDDTSIKPLCVKDEPRYELEVIEVPNVCLNKHDEIGSEDCDVVGTGTDTNDDGNNHHNDGGGNGDEEDDDSDSESVSFSDDSSSDSDSRTRSIDIAGDCEAAPPATGPCDDENADQPPHRMIEQRNDMAESRESARREHLNIDEKAVTREEIRLELDAYTALTKAFHASNDALSWAKAELLTDMRVHLHISNDEHLQVINEVANRKGRRYGRTGKF